MSNPTRAQVAAFAEAVAASGSPAMLIDEQNRNAGFVPIREAARLGFAFAVQVDSRILAVDIDEPGAETKLFRLVSAVTDVGLESVVVRSGRPGHHHLFASIDDLGFGNDLRAWGRIERFDVRGPGQRIRPPLAPHRMRDLRVSLADPLDAGEALARLRPPELRAATQTVPQTVRQLLETAKGSDWFPSRSEALFYVEQELVAAGYSDDRICDLILKGPLGAKAREKRRPRGWLLADIERARRKRRSHSPVVDSRFVSIEDALDTYTWAGRHHQSVRVVLQAHITIAARTSGVVYGGSERELAELAGITRKTVRKANETAIRLGFLQRIEVGSNQHSTRWRLRRPADVLQLPQSTPRGGVTSGVLVGHDVFRSRSGLPTSAAYVYAALSQIPVRPGSVMRKSGVGRSTVYRNLKLLSALDLACEGSNGWTRGPATLDDAADAIGAAGATARQRKLHELERAMYNHYLATRREGTAKRPADRRAHREGRLAEEQD